MTKKARVPDEKKIACLGSVEWFVSNNIEDDLVVGNDPAAWEWVLNVLTRERNKAMKRLGRI